MRTERFRQILENSRNIAPKRFASEKRNTESESVGLLVS